MLVGMRKTLPLPLSDRIASSRVTLDPVVFFSSIQSPFLSSPWLSTSLMTTPVRLGAVTALNWLAAAKVLTEVCAHLPAPATSRPYVTVACVDHENWSTTLLSVTSLGAYSLIASEAPRPKLPVTAGSSTRKAT